MHQGLRVLLVAGALFLASAANATILSFEAPLGLTGAQEIPAKVTPATGTGTATYDTTTFLLDVDLTWTDLLAPATASHIHIAASPGVNGPVAVDFVPAAFPNATSGTFSHTFDLSLSTSYGAGFLSSFGGNVNLARAAVIAGLIEGRGYFNIHNQINPGGEIRGNIALVPEPTSLALVGIGLVAAVARRRSIVAIVKRH